MVGLLVVSFSPQQPFPSITVFGCGESLGLFGCGESLGPNHAMEKKEVLKFGSNHVLLARVVAGHSVLSFLSFPR